MNWKEIGGKALDVAPSVIGALTGGNPLVTHGLEYLRDKITGKKGASQQEAEIAFTQMMMSEEGQLRLKQIEQDWNRFQLEHVQKMETLRIKEKEVFLTDIQSARKAHVDRTQATGKRDMFMYGMAVAVILGFFVTLGVVIKTPDISENTAAVQMLGAVQGALATILAFFFGSSMGSMVKNQLIGKTKPPKAVIVDE